MVATTPARLLTLKDYEALPEDDRFEREIICGRLYVSPRPKLAHQGLLVRLLVRFRDYLVAIGESEGQLVLEADLIIDTRRTYVSPDLMYFSPSQLPRLREVEKSGDWVAVPDLRPEQVVEVLSPGSRARDLREKLREYREAGIPHYWVFDTAAREMQEFVLDPAAGRYRHYRHAGGIVRPLIFAHRNPPFSLELDSLFD